MVNAADTSAVEMSFVSATLSVCVYVTVSDDKCGHYDDSADDDVILMLIPAAVATAVIRPRTSGAVTVLSTCVFSFLPRSPPFPVLPPSPLRFRCRLDVVRTTWFGPSLISSVSTFLRNSISHSHHSIVEVIDSTIGFAGRGQLCARSLLGQTHNGSHSNNDNCLII